MAENRLPALSTESIDWSILVGRLLHSIALVIYLTLTNPSIADDRVLAIAVSFAVSLVMMLLILIPSMQAYSAWGVMIGDWVLILLFAPLVAADSMGIIFLLVGLLSMSVVRLEPMQALVSSVISVILFVFSSKVLPVLPALPLWNSIDFMPIVVSSLLVAAIGVVAAFQRRTLLGNSAHLQNSIQERTETLRDMQERTRAITEMAHTLSSTLNYQRVLDTALQVGQLALGDLENGNFVSIVLLFRPEDRMLYTVTGRGLARTDEGRVVAGKRGVVADTLMVCEPVYRDSVRRDPELRHFLTFQRSRSVLTVPLRAGFDNYGVLIFGSETPNAFKERYRSLMEAIGIQTTIALQNAALYTEVAEEKERIVEVEEEARKKLARDLHDGPTQTVSAIAMRMAVIQAMLTRSPERIPEELKKIENLARQTTTEIRHMMFTLRPLSLESQGLTAALDQLAEKMDAVYDQKVAVMVSERAEDVLTGHQTGTVFYIIEEAVNNARKHAKSEVIHVRVSSYEDVILVEIADDGVGFIVEEVGSSYEGRGSLGMVNLHERAELIDGTLTIESAPGQGTTVSVVFPIDPGGTNERAVEEAPRKRSDGFRLSAIR